MICLDSKGVTGDWEIFGGEEMRKRDLTAKPATVTMADMDIVSRMINHSFLFDG